MHYTVELMVWVRRPLTIPDLEAVAAVGSVAEGRPGARRIETRLDDVVEKGIAESRLDPKLAQQALAFGWAAMVGCVASKRNEDILGAMADFSAD